ncbi:MAG: carbon-nitrogen hydrolase family protein [Nitrososphaerota archaeon]|nr:carbon-nitrogen hydrolase family protein [Nitrososphaerota archaeon]
MEEKDTEIKPVFKVAAAQLAPVFLDSDATLRKAAERIREAGSSGAELIVFPENFVPTHPIWFSLMHHSSAMQNFFPRLVKNAVMIPSRQTQVLCEAARESRCHVVMGLTEKDTEYTGTLYNTQLFIDDKGRILGKHRKLIPTSTERLVHTGGDGSTLSVFKTRLGEIGGLVCGEHTNPLACFALFSMGEKVHAASWPAFIGEKHQRNKETIDIRTKYYAFAGGVYVVSAAGICDQETISEIEKVSDLKGQANVASMGGHSAIIDPEGRFVSGPAGDREELVYGEVDLEREIVRKGQQDVIGHYNRPDIFSLRINRQKADLVQSAEN